MAKKKTTKKVEKKEDDLPKKEVVKPTEDVKEEPKVEEPKPKKEEKVDVYSFPSRSRCPRCGSIDTKATGKNKDKQYRKCLTPVCRNRYHVIGEKV